MVGKMCARKLAVSVDVMKEEVVKMGGRLRVAVAGFSILLLLQASLHATIVLSEFSSSPGLDASFLDAEVSFGVVGTTLTISIENLTPAGDAGYNIRELYFNATSNVTGLVLDSGITDWVLSSSPPVLPANGYGSFDYELHLTDPLGGTNLDKNLAWFKKGCFRVTVSVERASIVE